LGRGWRCVLREGAGRGERWWAWDHGWARMDRMDRMGCRWLGRNAVADGSLRSVMGVPVGT
jgi:hypothetical protein